MRESFVVHAEYIEDLPENCKDTYLHYIYDYGIFDKEPENLEGFEKSIWIKIKRRIDQDRQSYEERKEKNRKRQEEWRRKQGIDVPQTETSAAEETASEDVPTLITPSQTEYAERIFNIFEKAGLPCCRNNKITFLQTDFANGLMYLHQQPQYKHIHSDDVVQACENYAAVLDDPSTYFKTKMSFYKLVQSKIFYDLLPNNYLKTNFEKFENKKEDVPSVSEKKWYETCPHCKAKKVLWLNDQSIYKCESCGSLFKFGEI